MRLDRIVRSVACGSQLPARQAEHVCVCVRVCVHREGRTEGREEEQDGDACVVPQVLQYDYYGAYGNRAHRDHAYGRLLGDEYTFDFPPHHDVVSAQAPTPIPGAAGGSGGSILSTLCLAGSVWRRIWWCFSPPPPHCSVPRLGPARG